MSGFTKNAAFLYWLLAAASLFPWLAIQIVNSDIPSLTLAADTLLDNGTVGGALKIYSPSGIALQVIPAFAHRFAAIPLFHAALVYNLFLIALSCVATFTIIRRWPFLGIRDRRIFVTAYLLGNTVLAHHSLGEADHMVLLGLMPFLLLQAAMTFRLPLPPNPWRYAILVLGMLAILAKPLYALLPVLFLALRMLRQKRIFIIKDADFITLITGALLYTGIILLLFRKIADFLLPAISFPDSPLWADTTALFLGLLIPVLGIFASVLPVPEKKKYFIFGLLVSALTCFLVSVLQAQAYGYQFIPASVFALCGFSLILLFSLRRLKKWGERTPLYSIFILLIMLVYAIGILHQA